MGEYYRIVIADDEAILCMDLKEILEEAGHQVVGVAGDGLLALELVKQKKPDLAILDVKMPKLDGLQAAKMIAHENMAPVVLLTAFGDAEIIEKAKKSNVFGYVIKPVEEKTLFPAIQIAVSQFRNKMEIAGRIDRAKSLLMEHYEMTEKEAHHKIQEVSMKRGLALSEVAQRMIKEIMKKQNR